jgi:hypothetical protein
MARFCRADIAGPTAGPAAPADNAAMLFPRAAATVFVLVVSACAPSLDWRELRPEGTGVVALFPCKPTAQSRAVRLAGDKVTMTLLACTAGGATWALAHADLADPARVGPALAELRAAAAANLGASAGAAAALELPLTVPGATPNPASGRIELAGQRPDGQSAREQMAVFTQGTRVFQVTVLGERPAADALESFFGGLKFP